MSSEKEVTQPISAKELAKQLREVIHTNENLFQGELWKNFDLAADIENYSQSDPNLLCQRIEWAVSRLETMRSDPNCPGVSDPSWPYHKERNRALNEIEKIFRASIEVAMKPAEA